MNKSTQSVITIMALVLLASITFLFIIAQTTEAGPTKFKVTWWMYMCRVDAEPDIICIDWESRWEITKKYESLWHRIFGEHPHGYRIVYSKADNIEDVVLSCSECNYGL